MTRHTTVVVWRLVAALMFTALAGCRSAAEPSAEAPEGTLSADVTPGDPEEAATLQAEAAATAAWVGALTPGATATDEPFPTMARDAADGLPAVSLVGSGDCPVPAGFTLHVRSGFCLSAPEGWTAYNMDAGVAATLGTTPGQTLSLRPAWADSAAVCDFTVYLAGGESPYTPLEARYREFRDRTDLTSLSVLDVQTFGTLAIPGFLWESQDGASGGIFVDTVGVNRLLFASYSGTQCAADDVAPALNTLRIYGGP